MVAQSVKVEGMASVAPTTNNTVQNQSPSLTALVSLLADDMACLLYTSPSPRDRTRARMPSSA